MMTRLSALIMNKSRTRIIDHLHRQQRRKQRATCQVKKWMYENTAFERLNPHE
jgi:hypothetical protein